MVELEICKTFVDLTRNDPYAIEIVLITSDTVWNIDVKNIDPKNKKR